MGPSRDLWLVAVLSSTLSPNPLRIQFSLFAWSPGPSATGFFFALLVFVRVCFFFRPFLTVGTSHSFSRPHLFKGVLFLNFKSRATSGSTFSSHFRSLALPRPPPVFTLSAGPFWCSGVRFVAIPVVPISYWIHISPRAGVLGLSLPLFCGGDFESFPPLVFFLFIYSCKEGFSC